jgi:hypothetical protein
LGLLEESVVSLHKDRWGNLEDLIFVDFLRGRIIRDNAERVEEKKYE